MSVEKPLDSRACRSDRPIALSAIMARIHVDSLAAHLSRRSGAGSAADRATVKRDDPLALSLGHHTLRRRWIVAALIALVAIAAWVVLVAPAIVGFGTAAVGAMAWCLWLDRHPESNGDDPSPWDRSRLEQVTTAERRD